MAGLLDVAGPGSGGQFPHGHVQSDFLLRLAAAPARTAAVILGALLLLLIVAASLPAVLLLSTTARGHHRTDRLITQITTWTGTALTPGETP
ncbi:hypothetical protein KNE206_42410 [Kitasatospora sp. NE20-6]|uniref:hypothetical protein n=1 Tax=Kitasatospora sp. NE20-6 TaxID=2859066 RepID=UPI0034DBC532